MWAVWLAAVQLPETIQPKIEWCTKSSPSADSRCSMILWAGPTPKSKSILLGRSKSGSASWTSLWNRNFLTLTIFFSGNSAVIVSTMAVSTLMESVPRLASGRRLMWALWVLVGAVVFSISEMQVITGNHLTCNELAKRDVMNERVNPASTRALAFCFLPPGSIVTRQAMRSAVPDWREQILLTL